MPHARSHCRRKSSPTNSSRSSSSGCRRSLRRASHERRCHWEWHASRRPWQAPHQSRPAACTLTPSGRADRARIFCRRLQRRSRAAPDRHVRSVPLGRASARAAWPSLRRRAASPCTKRQPRSTPSSRGLQSRNARRQWLLRRDYPGPMIVYPWRARGRPQKGGTTRHARCEPLPHRAQSSQTPSSWALSPASGRS